MNNNVLLPLCCKECRYYRVYEDHEVARSEEYLKGECHRYPPQILVDHDGNMIVAWPEVEDDDDCGEFAPVPTRSPFAVAPVVP